ncbi:MAG TPA: ABC transporter substrate-binding protein [Anaerolineales bacterium]|nr:ABC transporter substrate-binding protein [Anaerolineales bacterium]HNC08584.1 ABC transporter substrate-binding protein [Anaerolineales bacterium]
MKLKNVFALMSILVILSMALAACAPASTEEPAMTEEAAVATEEPAMTEEAPAATEEPVSTERHGGWLDEIDFSVVSSDSAVSQLQAGAIDFYSFNLSSNTLQEIKDAGLNYTQSYGGNYGISLNPAVFDETTVLNPFSNHKIREAMNWLIDRNYVNQEIYGGGSLPKLLPITTQLVEYTNLIDTARALETKYAYNLERAREAIKTEMEGMGATLGADGKWQYNDAPVTLIFLIRSDGDGTRQPMGDYVSNQLEEVGFTVDRQYKTSSEAFPIWLGSVAAEGQWNLYTAGYLPSGLTRDEKANIQQYYLPSSIQASDPFISNIADPELQQIGDDLANGNFTSKDERDQMMRRALELALQDSLFVWVVDQLVYAPYNDNVSVTYDLAAGYEAAFMGNYNLRFKDEEGGTMKVGTNDLFTQPWNTIAGSNWVWDSNIMRATSIGATSAGPVTSGLMGDPYTGLAWPQRFESATLEYQTGLPITDNHLGWLTVSAVDEIPVPADAWVDWDAANQAFITTGDKYPDGTTAKIKSTVVYPADLFETVKWHDGSPISVADFVMAFIVPIDRAKPESAVYDESAAPSVEAALPFLKGFKIASTDPLTIEYYTDVYSADAELNVAPNWPGSPTGLSGENSWQIFAVSNLAEAAGELAYSSDKADANQIEQMSWVGGPSLDILKKYLDQAQAENYMPYKAVMEQFLTPEEVALRYENMSKWFGEHGHFWVGTGPYYLDQVFTTEKSLVLKNNTEFPDLANRWSSFSDPKRATVVLDGPGQVASGTEAVFDVIVNYKDEPYANADIKQVKFILYDATGEVITVGDAEAVGDGQYQVTLDAEVTSQLKSGAAKLEVAVVPIPVAIPAFTSFDFVVQ